MYGKIDAVNHNAINYPDKKFGIKNSEAYNEKYKDAIKRAKSFHIWGFTQIGMFDPFPDEPMETEFNIPQTEGDLVYRIDRYIEGQSPNCIYLPSKLILWKMMRACVDIEETKDLWYNTKF